MEYNNNPNISNKELYEALWGLDQKLSQQIAQMPSRSELYRVVGIALVLGQIAARLDITVPAWVHSIIPF